MIRELVRLELFRVVLRAIDIEPLFHKSNFFLFLSFRGSQSTTFSLLGLTGTPRYYIGKDPIWQLNISAKLLALSSSPLITTTSLFVKLIFSPDIIS
jgi:hypothetical protein